MQKVRFTSLNECFMQVLLYTNVLVVGETGKVLLTLPMYFLQMGNQIFCSAYICPPGNIVIVVSVSSRSRSDFLGERKV